MASEQQIAYVIKKRKAKIYMQGINTFGPLHVVQTDDVDEACKYKNKQGAIAHLYEFGLEGDYLVQKVVVSKQS